MNKLIKNQSGQLLGTIKETGNGQTICDASGKMLGRYDENQDRTYDRQGRNVGTGNQLTSLLKD